MTTENNFSALLDELDTLSKAMESGKGDKGDKKIKKAAEEGAEGDGEGSGAGDGEGEEFGKAFQVTLADGTKVDAFDGTEMMKALNDQNKALHAENETLGGAVRGLAERTIGLLKSQGDMIKALQTQVDGLRTQGTGRRAMLSVLDKPATTTAPAGGAGDKVTVKPSDVMAKARSLAADGTMRWSDVGRIEAHQQHGTICPPDLLARFPSLVG